VVIGKTRHHGKNGYADPGNFDWICIGSDHMFGCRDFAGFLNGMKILYPTPTFRKRNRDRRRERQHHRNEDLVVFHPVIDLPFPYFRTFFWPMGRLYFPARVFT